MRIEYKDYIIEPDIFGGFMLKKKAIATKKKDGEQYETEYTLGYNMQLSNCVTKIAHLELCDNEETMSLRDAVDLWNAKVNEIKQIITC